MFTFKSQYLFPIAIICLIILAGCPKVGDTDPGGSLPTATPSPAPQVTPVPQLPVNLGTAADYVILSGSTITNTGLTIVTGNMGLSPGSVVTGFPPGTCSGTQNVANAAAATAQLDLTAAFTDAAARTGAVTIATELGGNTLTPGAYKSAAGTFGITGTLTLNAQGNANAVFIFQIASTLIAANNSNIVLTGGAQAQNVIWLVGSSATLGSNAVFKGTILALASITANTGAAIQGRILARNGAVSLDTNAISQ